MRILSLAFLFLYSAYSYGQVQMTQEEKDKIIQYNMGTVYQGCLSSFEKSTARSNQELREQLDRELRLDPVDTEELKKRVENIKTVASQYYSYALSKSPDLQKSFEEDLEKIAQNKECQEEGNYCRGELIATAKFYFDFMRPRDPDCADYDPSKIKEKDLMAIQSEVASSGMNYARTPSKRALCHLEYSMKDQRLKRYDRADPRSRYAENTAQLANKALMDVQVYVLNISEGIDKKTKQELKSREVHICDPSKSKDSVLYSYPLEGVLYDQPYTLGISIGKKEDPKPEPKECIEEKTTLFSEFVPTNFEEGRSTVGKDQIDPVKAKIMNFINSNPNMIVTDVSVISSSSKTPFTSIINNKKVIDPKSDEKNLALAGERSGFASQVLDEMKASSSELSKINFSVKSELAGPDFSNADFELRKTSATSAGYSAKLKEMFESNKDLFASQALRKSSDELMDSKQFPTLYHAKFKPFQGFRITITGYVKEKMKCSDQSSSSGKSSPGAGKATKQ